VQFARHSTSPTLSTTADTRKAERRESRDESSRLRHVRSMVVPVYGVPHVETSSMLKASRRTSSQRPGKSLPWSYHSPVHAHTFLPFLHLDAVCPSCSSSSPPGSVSASYSYSSVVIYQYGAIPKSLHLRNPVFLSICNGFAFDTPCSPQHTPLRLRSVAAIYTFGNFYPQKCISLFP